ncbi:MAG: DNA methyltransferase [Candidatus Levyibacteriota bacterium]
MAIKYIPYTIEPLRGQAVLPFLRYHSQLTTKDFVVKGLPYYEAELVERVNGGSEDNLIIHGDCLNACAYLKEKNIKVDLVYIDPPFASGANYAKKIYIRKNPKLIAKLEAAEEAIKKQRAEEGAEIDNSDLQAIEETMYGDIWQKEDYLNWMYERLLAIKEVMSDTASIYVHLDEHIAHYVKIILDEIFGEENFKREVVWDIQVLSGYKTLAKNWIRGHDTIFYYANTKESIVFNKILQKHTEKYLSMFNQVDENGDKFMVAHGTKRYLKDVEGKGKPIGDVWSDIMSFQQQPTSSEKTDYATQKPQSLLTRIISASSNEGMMVADFFGGSGVTAIVAQQLGRKFITTDVGINSIQTIRDGLDEAGAKFDVLKIKDGIDLFRNPEQTMEKLATVIPGLSTKHDYGKFWFGAITEDGKICPCWVPNLLDKSQAILNAALFTKILDEAAKLETVSKVVICSVDKIEDKEIDKMISDYDLRDQEGKKIEFVFKDLKELTDLLVYPDIVEYTLSEKDGKYEITFNRFISDNLMRKIDEYNAKKKTKQKALIAENETDTEEEAPQTKIEISEEGLELIEYISIDCTNKDGSWNSNEEIKIDKRGYVIHNGEKTKEFWNGKIVVDKKPLRIKVRNIAGDETIIHTENLQGY